MQKYPLQTDDSKATADKNAAAMLITPIAGLSKPKPSDILSTSYIF
jgi:hypothetical protein